jgi:hypothetical protein
MLIKLASGQPQHCRVLWTRGYVSNKDLTMWFLATVTIAGKLVCWFG